MEKKYDKMTDEQLIRDLRAGERKIIDYIMDKYKFLVKKKAKAMFLLGGENDDLIQEGMIGLFKAVQDYDENQEASFYSFADLCVSRQMYTAMEASKRQKHIPLNSYISLYDEGEDQPLIETIQSVKDRNPEEMFLDKEYLETIRSELEKSLSDLENRVFYLHMQGIDYQTIAKLLNKSCKSIDNALQRIKNKTEKIIEKSVKG